MTLGSCADFHDKVLGFITEATPAALHIENKLAAYEEVTQKLASVVNRQQAFVSTKALAEADDYRDCACGTICAAVNAFVNSPSKERREAARLLAPQLAPYKGIRRHNYSKETAEIKGMYAILTAEDNAAAVATLSLNIETELLREANEAFEKLFLQKAAEAGEKAKVSELDSNELMAEANTLYAEIVDIVNAYALIQTSPEVEAFVENVNGLVEVYSREAGGTGGTALADIDVPQADSGDEDEDDGHEGPAIS